MELSVGFQRVRVCACAWAGWQSCGSPASRSGANDPGSPKNVYGQPLHRIHSRTELRDLSIDRPARPRPTERALYHDSSAKLNQSLPDIPRHPFDGGAIVLE